MGEYTQFMPPTAEERAKFDIEYAALAYHQAGAAVDPTNPALSSDPREWGVHPTIKPPVDCVDFVSAYFKREIAQVDQREFLKPEIKFSIVAICTAHFLWLTTKHGADWLLATCGIEEVAPHHGYVYYYMHPTSKQLFEVSEQSGLRLRIFQRCAPNQNPSITHDGPERGAVIEQFKKLLLERRSPFYQTAPRSPTDGMFHWVSGKILEWLREPSKDVPFLPAKADRLTGPNWIRGAKRPDGSLRFNAVTRMELFRGRAFRIQDRNGEVIWCGGEDIRHPDKPSLARTQKTLTEEQIKNVYGCASCGNTRCCTVDTGSHQRMCCHCIGTLIEKDDRPSLNFCTMKECRTCPDFVTSEDELVRIISRLNREPDFPVRR